MRQIKFRVWDRKEKKMFNVLEIKFHYDPLRFDEFKQVFLDGRWSVNGCKPWDFQWRDKDDVELMQFTGLHDKNGKEIYEGDFIGGIYESLYVGWCDKCASFQLLSAGYCFGCEGDINWLEFVNDETKEIIGNIYENPELLEGGK